jgi:hypothetical protein
MTSSTVPLQACWLSPVDPVTGRPCPAAPELSAGGRRDPVSSTVPVPVPVPVVVGGGVGVTRMFCAFCATVQPVHRACQNPGCTHVGQPTRYYCAPCAVWRHDGAARFHCWACRCCRPGTPLMYMHTSALSRCRSVFL